LITHYRMEEAMSKQCATNTSHRDPRGDIDLVNLYVRDIRGGDRLSKEEEARITEEIVTTRQELAGIAHAVLWKAGDTLDVEPSREAQLTRERAPSKRGRRRRNRPLAEYLAEVERVGESSGTAEPASAAGSAQPPCVPLSSRQIEAVLDKIECAGRLVESGRARSRNALADVAACFGLTVEDLRAVVGRIRDRRTRLAAARDRMIAANLKLVVSLARSFRRRAIDPADLIQEGNIALLRAVDAFDPRRGYGFAALACTIIRRAMNAFVMANCKPVRVPKQTLELRRRVMAAAWELGEKDGVTVEPAALAAYLELPLRVVVDALVVNEDRVSLDETHEDRNESVGSRLADPSWEDAGDALATHQHEGQIADVVADLDQRDRKLLQARYGSAESATLAEIGESLGVTRERTRQLEARALRRLRQRGSGEGAF
jgi:RNA polymerase sigma factor (sigma-70 family)